MRPDLFEVVQPLVQTRQPPGHQVDVVEDDPVTLDKQKKKHAGTFFLELELTITDKHALVWLGFLLLAGVIANEECVRRHTPR